LVLIENTNSIRGERDEDYKGSQRADSGV
jgi:hypothetical protein